MALRFVDGFDYYGQFANEWQGNYNLIFANGDTFRWTMQTGRTGSGKAVRIAPNSQGDAFAMRTPGLTLVGNTIIVALGRRYFGAGDSTSLIVRNSALAEVFRVNTTATGSLTVKIGSTVILTTPPGLLVDGVWGHQAVKVVLDAVAGSAAVQYNGVDVGSVEGVNTIANPINDGLFFVDFYRGAATNQGNIGEYDDIVIMDGSGAHFNDFIGDRTVITLPVVSDAGPNQWTPSAGTDHYALVDEIGPNSADYLTADTTGQQELFSVANLPAGYAGASDIAICVKARAFKSDAGSRLLKLLYQPSGGSVTASASMALGTTAQYVSTIVETNPLTGLPFTQAEIDALSIGVEAA